MSILPQLSTGAAQQYPYVRSSVSVTRTLKLADGSEQRFVLLPHHNIWYINLHLLQEQERTDFLAFAQQNMRSVQTFAFTDPQDGIEYPTCRVVIAPVTDYIDGVARTGIQIMIAEVQP